MAEIPQPWNAYARLQHKLSATNSIVISAALEEALNVVHQPDFQPETVAESDLLRIAASAARQGRHRGVLRRRAQAEALDEPLAAGTSSDDGDVAGRARSLDDAVHARRELARLAAMLCEPDWELLTAVAVGVSYAELAAQHSSTSAALRSRICRLRQTIE